MGIKKLFRPSEIRRLSKDETMALYKRHAVAQYERAEAAEARCARLQQALAEVRQVCEEDVGMILCDCDVDDGSICLAHRVLALAGPDTPADSQEDSQ